MKEVKHTCDYCKKEIEGHQQNVCAITYQGIIGHNQIPNTGWHYHYDCMCFVVEGILKSNTNL